MGIGLQWAGANDAMAQSVRQRIMDQIAAEQRQKADTQQQFENQMREKQFQSGEDLKNAQLQALIEQRSQAEKDRQLAGAGRLGDEVQAGQTIPLDSPIAAPLKMVGQLRTNTTLPSTQMAGAMTLPDTLSSLSGNESAPISGQLRIAQSPEAPRDYTKIASSKQQETQDAADAKVEAARQRAEDAAAAETSRAADRVNAIKVAAASRPIPDKLVKVEHQDPNTGKTIIEWLPESQVKGKTFAKGVSGATENRLASAEAVNQTGNDIIAKLQDPTYAKSLGVAMGRFSKLQDFIGNPPPEFSELAGQIESYALANMGVHGMRSAQGAEKISKMLSQPHTPESLISTIKGLQGFSQHFMQNEGRGSAITAPAAPAETAKPSAADLIKKYGGD